MSDIHIDDFYKDSAKILVQLYNHFPRKITLYVDEISGPDQPDEFGLHSPRYDACFQTMLWLASSGYIAYEQLVYQDALDQACLTQRAFLTLSSPLEGTEGDSPELFGGLNDLAINQIKQELERGTSFSLASVMKRMMQRSLRFA